MNLQKWVVNFNINTLSYIEPINAALRHGCKVIVHSRNAGASKSIITNVLHHIHSVILPKDKIKMIAVSDLAGKWLFGKNTEFQTINNGIDIDKFRFNREKREKIRREMKIEDKYIVGNVGAFLYAKNHRFLVKVFYELVQKKPEAVLLLIGTGSMKEEILNLVNEMGLQQKVYFLGRRTDVSDLLSVMDCFLFPSLYEGFPNAVLEAQCSGLPCVISDNITDEVVLAENCIKLSLNLSLQQWANKLLNMEGYQNRNFASEILKKSGYSVKEEIKKVESVYISQIK